MERVFDPFVADLQAEWIEGQSSGRRSYARWRLFNAYCALLVQVIVCGIGSLVSPARVPVATTGSIAPGSLDPSPVGRWFRFGGPLVFASGITFGLFALMSALIAVQPGNRVDKEEFTMDITMVRLIPDPISAPPEEPPLVRPVETTEPTIDSVVIPTATASIRDLLPSPIGTEGIQIPGAPVKINMAAIEDREATPLVRVNPVYPSRALQRGVEGWVEIEFTIDASGGVSNPRVLDAKPPVTFNRAALRAIERWKYEPMLIDGKAIAQPGARTRLIFELE
jgi:protein TonB